MSRTIAKVRMTATKEDLRSYLEREAADRAALLFFLAGAEKEGLMLQGHHAADVFAAAGRLLRLEPDSLDRVREAVA